VPTNIQAGQIIRLYCKGNHLNKYKYFLVLSFPKSGEPILFIINSKLSNFIKSRLRIKAAQLRIHKNDYPFLKHDSYINCSEIKWWFTKEKIIEQLKRNKNNILGNIHSKHIKSILNIVHNSDLLKELEKELIFKSLNNILK